MSESPRQAISSIIGQLIVDVIVVGRAYQEIATTHVPSSWDKLRDKYLTRIMTLYNNGPQGRRSGTKDRRAS